MLTISVTSVIKILSLGCYILVSWFRWIIGCLGRLGSVFLFIVKVWGLKECLLFHIGTIQLQDHKIWWNILLISRSWGCKIVIGSYLYFYEFSTHQLQYRNCRFLLFILLRLAIMIELFWSFRIICRWMCCRRGFLLRYFRTLGIVDFTIF